MGEFDPVRILVLRVPNRGEEPRLAFFAVSAPVTIVYAFDRD
jgi:hypothetical protein